MTKQQAMAVLQQARTALFPYNNPDDDPNRLRAADQITYGQAIALLSGLSDRPCKATVSESIYASRSVIVPLADVQHIEQWADGQLVVVTKHTSWDFEQDFWANPINIAANDAAAFKAAWCRYRGELEADTLTDLATKLCPAT